MSAAAQAISQAVPGCINNKGHTKYQIDVALLIGYGFDVVLETAIGR